jgi:hypothetical protein
MDKVWCYVENLDKPVADCVANGCWGGEAFMVECLGNKPSDVLAERYARMSTINRVAVSTIKGWGEGMQDWTPDKERVWHLIDPQPKDERDYMQSYCGQPFYYDEQGELELLPNAKGLRCHDCLRLSPKVD